jgi:putative membrane-bound dehydrogenase-like protein
MAAVALAAMLPLASLAEIPKPTDAPMPLPPAEAAKTFRVPAGMRLELVAAEPLIREPTGVCWDAKGRLYVSELHGYNLEGQYDIEELNKTGRLDTEVRRVHAAPEARQKAAAETFGTVKLLSDTDGDGLMDKATVFADHIPPCYGLCPARDGIIAVGPPQILFLADRDGDGIAEVREVLYEGFKVGILERNINAPQWGHDDWIYFGSGQTADRVTGPRLDKPVDLALTDFRMKADGTAIEPITGRTVTVGFAITDRDERIAIWTNSPGIIVAPLRWKDLERNSDYASGSLQHPIGDPKTYPTSKPHPWRTKRAENAEFAKFYKDRYGASDSDASGSFTSACSPLVYQDAALPGLDGDLLTCEPAQNMVHRGRIDRTGGSFEIVRVPEEKKAEFLSSSDVWFHPVALAHGPDGSLYVADFYREIIEDYSAIPRYLQQQYELNHGVDRGRIWRLVPERKPAAMQADMTGLTATQLTAELASPRFWRRQTARRLLVERKDGSDAAAIARLVADDRPAVAAINALHTLSSLGRLEAATVRAGLGHPAAAVRIHSIRLAEPLLADAAAVADRVLALAADDDIDVVRQVAASLGTITSATGAARTAADGRALAALAAIARSRGQTPWMDAAVMTALPGRAGEMLAMLLSDPDGLGEARALLRPLARAIAARKNPQELSPAICAIAKIDEAGLRQTCWTGLREAFSAPTRVALDAPAVAALKAAASDTNPRLAEAGQALVRLLKVESFDERAARIAAGVKTAGDIQASDERRLAVIAELAGEEDETVTAGLVAAFPSATPAVREAVLQALFARRNRLPVVMAAVEADSIPASALSAVQRQALLEHPEPAVREQAARQFAKLTAGLDASLALYAAALENPRDRARGAALFRQHCGVCHKAHGVGVAVGPELSGEAKQPEQTLLKSILAPNSQITAGYATYTVLTDDGQVFTGLLGADTAASVTLKQQEGKTQTLLRKEIDEIKASSASLMPESLAKTLSPQDVADILGWLREPTAP